MHNGWFSYCECSCIWVSLQPGGLSTSCYFKENREFWVNHTIAKLSHLFIKGWSYFYILKDNAVKPLLTGGVHWLEFLPGHVYCFLPSLRGDVGSVRVYDHMPEFIKDFSLCMEIKEVFLKMIIYYYKLGHSRLLFLLQSYKRMP